MTNSVRSYLSRSALAPMAAVFLLALCAVLLVSAPPAAAHDELTGSTPGDGSVLDTAPESVELTFSNIPAAIGSEVRVLDEEGTDWAEGSVRILDNTATQKLRAGAPAGSYTVQWRVVSSDAHPIEGTFGFTVAGGTPATDAARDTAAESTAAPLPPEASQSPVLSQSDDAGSSWPVIVAAAVVLLAVAVLIALIVRRRLRED